MVKKIKNSLLILFTIFWCGNIVAQEYSYKHYGVEDGLPSSEVYSAFQDSKGYMWFATDAGVSRFNGYEFENFDINNGLTDNTVFLITEDNKGRVWFGTFNCQLSYYANGDIIPYKYNDKITESIHGDAIIIDLKVDKEGTVWLGFKDFGIIGINYLGNVISNFQSTNQIKLCIQKDTTFFIGGTLKAEKLKEGLNYVDTIIIESTSKSGEKKLEQIRYNFTHDYKGIRNPIFESLGNQKVFYSINSRCFFLLDLNNLHCDTLLLEDSFIDNFLLDIHYDGIYIWLTVFNQGVFQCKVENNKLKLVNHYLAEKQVSKFYSSKNGDRWFMTLNNGVYYLSSKRIYHRVFTGEKISAIEIDKKASTIFTLINNKKLVSANPGFKELITHQTNSQNIKFNSFNNKLYLTKAFEIVKFFKGKETRKIKNLSVYNGNTKAILNVKDTMYMVNSYGLSKIVNDEEVFFSFHNKKRLRCSSIAQYNNEIWIGTNQGVKVLQDETIYSPYKNNRFLSSPITDIVNYKNRFFLVGTKLYGLLILKDEEIFQVIDSRKGLGSNTIKTIHVDEDFDIWIGTNKGLDKIQFTDTYFEVTKNLSQNKGFSIYEITDIESLQDTIFIGTNKGLFFFNKNINIQSKQSPKIYITSCKVNNKEHPLINDLNLNYNQNNLIISFESVNYRSLDGVEYKYRLNNIDSGWVKTNTRAVNFSSLQPGNYIFELKASNEDGFWGKPVRLKFKISPPFWLTWWFVMIIIAIIVILILIGARYRDKKISQRLKSQKREIELELKALRSQINPHFIFNTLNSIQYYISVNDFKSSNKYLTEYAKLIRLVLHHSEKNKVLIKEELAFLTLYLNLEKMRFRNQFDYDIIVDKEIKCNSDKIPSMLIQPYVENAIWHGLMNKKGKGEIKINIKKEENYFQCIIEDNGVGRKRASEFKEKRGISRKSIGMSITKERLTTFNENNNNVEIMDISDVKGNALGTRVILKIKQKL